MAASDVINQIKATIIPNGVGAITAPVLSSVLIAITTLFTTPLGGDVNGTFPTITINNGAVTAAKMATGAVAASLGYTPYNPATGGSLGGAVSSTISVTSPAVSATSALQGPAATFAALTAAVKPAGSSAFCSDCLKSGQATGAGTGMPVFSDGTAWFYASGTVITH